jgi:ribonuclease HI
MNDINCIHVYTDGACSGNPGPAGIGVLLFYNSHKKEVSEFIGDSTNNIAELTAIRRGLETIKTTKRDIPIKIYTDSGYAIGLFTKNWEAKKNIELVESIKYLLKKFEIIEFIKVKGHSNMRGNNRADYLAKEAIKKGKLNGTTGELL